MHLLDLVVLQDICGRERPEVDEIQKDWEISSFLQVKSGQARQLKVLADNGMSFTAYTFRLQAPLAKTFA